MSWVNQEPTNLPWMMARMDSCLVPSSESGRHRASLIRDGEMSHRGSTIMLDVFRKSQNFQHHVRNSLSPSNRISPEIFFYFWKNNDTCFWKCFFCYFCETSMLQCDLSSAHLWHCFCLAASKVLSSHQAAI
jgi:hypothetical protein